MNLYRISQTENNDYDTYDSAVVAASSESAARKVHPAGKAGSIGGEWVAPDKVKVELIGVAKRGIKAGVVLASFNAA